MKNAHHHNRIVQKYMNFLKCSIVIFLISLLVSCSKPQVDCICDLNGTVYELEFKKLERCTQEGGTAICV